MEFLWSLIGSTYNSWNTTYQMQQFNQSVPEFMSLNPEVQEEVVSVLSSEAIEGWQYVWAKRDSILGEEDISFSDFVTHYILDPNATVYLLPELLPTAAELCVEYFRVFVFVGSLIMIAPSTFILIVLMFIKPRKKIAKGCCWGRPSFLVPLNFIDEHGRRWAYCGAFAMMTNFLLDFFSGKFFWYPGNWEDPTFALSFSWAKPFILLGNTVHLGYLFYPIFACLSLRRHIPANILGLLYSLLWIYYHVDDVIECPIGVDRETQQFSSDALERIVTLVPVFLGELALIFAFILDLVINSYQCHQQRSKKDVEKKKSRWGGKETLPLQYIEHLMTTETSKPKTLKDKIKDFFTYTRVAGFQYPPRVICTMIVAFILLLSIGISIGYALRSIFVPLEKATGITVLLQQLLAVEDITDKNIDPIIIKILVQAPRYVSGIHASFIFGNVASSLIHVISMIHMTRTYRNHVRLVMRGDRSWHHEYDNSPPSKLSLGMRYSGYQIAYILWGYVIMFLLIALVASTLTVIVIIPLTFGESPFLLNTIIVVASTAVGTFVINISQTLLSKFVFLQERGAHLALDNRRMYHGMSFFVFFFNLILGAFSVLRRSLFALIFGTILLCRLDRCLLMRGFERFDTGFSAYMGMLEVDATHNHPVMKGFIYILKGEVKDSQERHVKKNDVTENGMTENKRKIDKRIRNKWWKLITLVNNPVLVIERLQKKVEEERQKKAGLRDDVVNMIADTGAVFVGSMAVGTASTVVEINA